MGGGGDERQGTRDEDFIMPRLLKTGTDKGIEYMYFPEVDISISTLHNSPPDPLLSKQQGTLALPPLYAQAHTPHRHHYMHAPISSTSTPQHSPRHVCTEQHTTGYARGGKEKTMQSISYMNMGPPSSSPRHHLHLHGPPVPAYKIPAPPFVPTCNYLAKTLTAPSPPPLTT